MQALLSQLKWSRFITNNLKKFFPKIILWLLELFPLLYRLQEKLKLFELCLLSRGAFDEKIHPSPVPDCYHGLQTLRKSWISILKLNKIEINLRGWNSYRCRLLKNEMQQNVRRFLNLTNDIIKFTVYENTVFQ